MTEASNLSRSFVNVSKIQWLEVLEGDDTIDSAVGSYVLSYNGAETTCLEWNSIAQLRYALNGLSSLAKALPVNVQRYAKAGGWKHKLTFSGREAPGILGVETSRCDNEVSATVYMDPDMLSSAVFRYKVQPGDTAVQIGTDKASLGFTDTNYLKISVAPYVRHWRWSNGGGFRYDSR